MVGRRASGRGAGSVPMPCLHTPTSRRSTSAFATLDLSWASSRLRLATWAGWQRARASRWAGADPALGTPKQTPERVLRSRCPQQAAFNRHIGRPARQLASPARLELEHPDLVQPVAVLRLPPRQRALLHLDLLVQQAQLLVAAHQLRRCSRWREAGERRRVGSKVQGRAREPSAQRKTKAGTAGGQQATGAPSARTAAPPARSARRAPPPPGRTPSSA